MAPNIYLNGGCSMFKSVRYVGLVLLLLLITPLVSQSATIEVMNTNDSGPGSLRQAIADANPAGGDDIIFNPSLDGELFLINTPLTIDKSLTITGLGKDKMALENNNTVEEPFVVVENAGEGITVILQELEIRNNDDVTIHNSGENLTINNSRIRGGQFCVENSSASELFVNDSIIELCQFGVTNSPGDSVDGTAPGTATISRSDINGNDFGINNNGGNFDADPGAVITIYDTTIRNNTLFGITNAGGAFSTATGGTVNMFRTSVVNNATGISNSGGAFDSAVGAVFNAQNSTIAGNTGRGVVNSGGANNSSLGASFKCLFCTIANNDGTGVENRPPDNGNPGEVELLNTIVANNGDQTTTFNCIANANFVTSATSKVTDNTCTIPPVTLLSLELGPLQNNGGFTDTIAIGATSSAKDVIAPIGCIDLDLNPLTNDQRELVRPFNTNCDVGAFEYQPTGTITIEKQTFPPGVRNIDFSTAGLPDSCEMSDGFELNDGESITCSGLAADGTIYAFWESPVQPFNLFDIECVGNTNGLIPVIAGLGGIRFSLAGGDDVTCTFKNDVIPFNLNGVIPKAAGAKNFILFDGAQPNENVDIYWGFVPQTEQLFDDSCPGIDVGIKNPRFLAEAVADSNGEIQYSVFVPGGAAGLTIIFQGVAQENCRVSNRIPVLFTDDN